MQIKIFAMRDIIDFKESFPRKMEFSGAKLSEDTVHEYRRNRLT